MNPERITRNGWPKPATKPSSMAGLGLGGGAMRFSYNEGNTEANLGEDAAPPRMSTNEGALAKLSIGTERLRVRDGVILRKVDNTGSSKRDWKRTEVIEWEEHTGPVPAGFLLVLRPGASRRWDNLQLKDANDAPVTLAQAARKSIPPELRALAGIKGLFTKEMRRIEGLHDTRSFGPRRIWSDEEIAYLRASYPAVPIETIASHLNRPPATVRAKVQKLGISVKPLVPWRIEEDLCLRRLYATTPASEIGARLGRSRDAVRKRAGVLGLHKPETATWIDTRATWTDKETSRLIRDYPTMPMSAIASRLGRSEKSCRAKVKRLQLQTGGQS